MNLLQLTGCWVAVFSLGLSLESQAQITRQYQQTFEMPKNIDHLRLYARSPHVIVRRSKGKTLHIQTTVTTNVPNQELLDLLAKKGRYTLMVTQPEKNTWEVTPICRPGDLIYKDMPVREDLVYFVTMPARVEEFESGECRVRDEFSTSFIQPY